MYKKLLFWRFAAARRGARIFREAAGFLERIQHFLQCGLATSATGADTRACFVEQSPESIAATGDGRLDLRLGDGVT